MTKEQRIQTARDLAISGELRPRHLCVVFGWSLSTVYFNIDSFDHYPKRERMHKKITLASVVQFIKEQY